MSHRSTRTKTDRGEFLEQRIQHRNSDAENQNGCFSGSTTRRMAEVHERTPDLLKEHMENWTAPVRSEN
jgi:hypothetical protein